MEYFKLDLKLFDQNRLSSDFYVNRFSVHLKQHHDHIKHIHSHDFYITLLVTKGFGTHTIDFQEYPISPGSVFFLQPKQLHEWSFKQEPEGWIFFHSEQFYTLTNPNKPLNDWPFFDSQKALPSIQLSYSAIGKIEPYFMQLFAEYSELDGLSFLKIGALQQIIYTDLSRMYKGELQSKTTTELRAKEWVNKFKKLLETEETPKQYSSYYADKLALSSKHLHRVCEQILQKNPTQLISEQLIFLAKRRLIQENKNLEQLSYDLGFESYPYFSRFFKKNVGISPSEFRKRNT